MMYLTITAYLTNDSPSLTAHTSSAETAIMQRVGGYERYGPSSTIMLEQLWIQNTGLRAVPSPKSYRWCSVHIIQYTRRAWESN